MTPVADARARPAPADADGTPHLLLAANGREAEVDGAVLEGAFRTTGGDLVVVSTDDVPYEERVSVTLLGPDGDAVVDRYEIGAPYTPGIVSNLAAVGGRLEFSFAGARFAVTHDPAGRIAWPGTLPRGVRRRTAPWRRARLRFARDD